MTTDGTSGTRKVMDCRRFPSESNCSLVISGTEEEVLAAATAHAVSWHEHEDTPELRAEIRATLEDEHVAATQQQWAQLMKMHVLPGNEDAMRAIEAQWEEQIGRGTDSGWIGSSILRSVQNPSEWYSLVSFESEAKARANEKTAKHQAVVSQFEPLIDGPPEYVDLTPIADNKRQSGVAAEGA